MEKKKDSRDDFEQILTLFDIYSEITLEQIQKILSVSRTTATRRVNKLINLGKIVRIGKTRSTRFRLL